MTASAYGLSVRNKDMMNSRRLEWNITEEEWEKESDGRVGGGGEKVVR